MLFLLDTLHMAAVCGLLLALAAMAWERLARPVLDSAAALIVRLRRRLRRRG